MLPVKKLSRTRTRTRRAHHALKPVNYSVCKQCGEAILPHTACDNCGYVNSKITIERGTKEAAN